MEDKVYHSKGFAAFSAILAGVLALSFVVVYFSTPMGLGKCIIAWLLSCGLVFLLSYPFKYALTRNSLKIRAGFLCMNIPYGKIDGAESGISALCPCNLGYGLCGLVIRERSGMLKEMGISPQNQEEFLEELERRVQDCRG